MVKKLPDTSLADTKRKNVVSKIVFVSAMVALVLGGYAVGNRKQPQVKTSVESKYEQEKGSVMGNQTSKEFEDLQNALTNQAGELKNTLVYYEAQLEDATRNIIQDNKEEVQKRTSEVIYTTAVKPLLDKIRDLPDDQQEIIKEELCR